MNKKLLLLLLAPLSLSAANIREMKKFFLSSSRNLFFSPSDFDGDEAVIEKYLKMSPREQEQDSNRTKYAEDDRRGAKLERLAAAVFKLQEQEHENTLPSQKITIFSSDVDEYCCSQSSLKLTRENLKKLDRSETPPTK